MEIRKAIKPVNDFKKSAKIPDEVAAILFDEKIEEQVGFNVKKSNRDIARAMTLDDLQGTDLGAFFDRVEEICRSA